MTGELFVPMTNDYLFRAMLQRNNTILKGLIRSLLGLGEEDIKSVIIKNPIELGEAIDESTFILDILVELNDSELINLEMQVINEKNWVERSLAYLCRTYSAMGKDETYIDLKPVHQIGILNFTLFEDAPEFYANYDFLNVKSHRPYSDKLKLSVLDLTRIDLATEEDKKKELDYWAELFKSETWEEICMLAEKEPIFSEVATEVQKLSKEEKIRLQCFAREDYYRTQRDNEKYFNRVKQELEEELAKKDKAISEKDKAISEKDKAISEKDKAISEKDKAIFEQQKLIEELQAKLEAKGN